MRNVTDGAWLWILAKAVHRAKRQSHFIRLRDQRILRNPMRILRKKYKSVGYVSGVASIDTGMVSASSNLTYKALWQMCVSKVAYIGHVPASRFRYKNLELWVRSLHLSSSKTIKCTVEHDLKLNSLRYRLSPSFWLNRQYSVLLPVDVEKPLFENLYSFIRNRRAGTAQSVKWQGYRLNDGDKWWGTRQMQDFVLLEIFRPALVPKHRPWQWTSAALSTGEIFRGVKLTTFYWV